MSRTRALGESAENSVIIISSESSEEEDDEAEQLSDVQRYRHLKGLLKISHECEMSVLLTHTVQVTMQMRAMKRVHGRGNKVGSLRNLNRARYSAISRLKRQEIIARGRGESAEDSVVIISSESRRGRFPSDDSESFLRGR